MLPKNLARSLAIAAVFTGGFFAADAVQEPQAVYASSTTIDGFTYSAEVVEALNEINKYRTASGLQPYKIDPFLSKSADAHAKYLTTHVKSTSHDETPGKSGFTGAEFTDRAKSAGYTVNSGSESVAYGNVGVKRQIEDLVEGIYHRDTILNSFCDTVGIGVNGKAIVIVADNTDSQGGQKVMYPYNGQTDAPTLFDVKERPDPLAKYGVKTSGYIISYTPDGALGWFGGHTMTLKDSKENLVHLHNKNNEPDEDGNTMFIVPKSELKKGEKYTVNVEYLDIHDIKHTHSWSFTTAGTASQQPIPTEPTNPSTPDYSKYAKQFGDFDAKAWWAGDMIWAVEKGIISGYGNVWNPKTKKYETHLKPNEPLTEAHFLMIFFRLTEPTTYNSMQPTSKWTYNVPYRLASSLNMPTLANESSTTKMNLATQGIRRGKLAQLLVSYHEGKQVSEATAINFMIQHKLTASTTVKDYNANQILTRSQISAFLQRYEAFAQ